MTDIRRKVRILIWSTLICLTVLLCGCQKKGKQYYVLPLNNHPAVSFEPLFSVKDAYDSALLDDVPYDQLSNQGVVSVENGQACLGYIHTNRTLFSYVDQNGVVVGNDTFELSVRGEPQAFFSDGNRRFVWIASLERNTVAEIVDSSLGKTVQLPDTNFEESIGYQAMSIDGDTIFYVLDDKLVEMDWNGNVIRDRKLEEGFADIAISRSCVFILEEIGQYNGMQKFRLTQLKRDSLKQMSMIEFVGEEDNWISPSLSKDVVEDSVVMNMGSGIVRCCPQTQSFELLVNLADYGIDDASIVEITEDALIMGASFDVVGEREAFSGLIKCSFSVEGKQKLPVRVVQFLVGGDYSSVLAAFNRSQSEYYCEIIDTSSILEGKVSETATEEEIKHAFLELLTNQNQVDMFFFTMDDLTYFTNNHVLVDLNQILGDNLPVVQNIWQASEKNGNRYYITPFYSLVFESYDENIVSAESLVYENINSLENIHRVFHVNDFQSYVEIERSGAFIRKELEEKGEISEKTLLDYIHILGMNSNLYYESMSLHEEIANRNVLMIDSTVSRYDDAVGLRAFWGEQMTVCGPWGYSSPAITSNEVIGVSSGSTNFEGCSSLISFILSYEVQYSFAGKELGLPIHEQALEDYLDYCVENSDTEAEETLFYEEASSFQSDFERDEYDKELEREFKQILSETERGETHSDVKQTKRPLPNGVVLPSTKEEYAGVSKLLLDWIASANEYYLIDKEINSILYEEYLTLRSGAKNESDIASSMKSRLDLYWAEQNL